VAVLLAACVGLVAANSDRSSAQEWAESSSWEGNVLHPFYDAVPATKITTLDTLPPIGTRARTSGSLPSVPITLNEDHLSLALPLLRTWTNDAAATAPALVGVVVFSQASDRRPTRRAPMTRTPTLRPSRSTR